MLRTATVSLATLLFTTTSAAQSPQPAAPPDSVVRSVITLVQTGDLSRRGQVLSRILSASARAKDSARVDRLINALAIDGAPYDVVKVDSVGRHAFVKLRSRRVPRALTLDVGTDRGEPGMVGIIDVLEAHPLVLDSVQWPTTRLASRAALVSLVRRNLDRLAAGGAFQGTVYIARGDSVVFARGYGFSDLEDSVRNGVHTRFTIASMGKMFTATAILQLVEAGKFGLDDTLAKVLPAYPNADRARRVTVRQLLQHTAGMGDQWSTPRKPVEGLTGALAYAAAVAYPPLLFEPGTRWSYSNEGYSVLAAIVEQHSGETFADYVQRHILDRAGMKETALKSSGADIIPHRAVGYYPADDDPLGIRAPRANWSF
ncbi:MAG TPA: serine hydrolase domain-containing protein, partial [Gemmatimonadaceae bacterium]|nr:serine hydrolase domain-containing protein [Gemmatimonadaceae bacterium]